jgi:hypothetical protein
MPDEGFSFLTSGDSKAPWAAEGGVCFGTSGEAGVRFGTLGIHLRAPLTIEVEARGASAGQSSRDIPRGDIDFRRYRRSLSPKNQLDPFVDVMH